MVTKHCDAGKLSWVFIIPFLLIYLTSCSPKFETDPNNLYKDKQVTEEIRNNNVREAKNLIRKDPDAVKKLDPEGKTPLTVAIITGNKEMTDFLIAQGAPLNTTDGNKMSPVHWAITKGQMDLVKTLIDSGADPHIKDGKGWTPLHYAASKGDTKLIQYLHERKLDLNAKDDAGWTPLHVALAQGHEQAVDLLIALGANPNIANNKGVVPKKVLERRKAREARRRQRRTVEEKPLKQRLTDTDNINKSILNNMKDPKQREMFQKNLEQMKKSKDTKKTE